MFIADSDKECPSTSACSDEHEFIYVSATVLAMARAASSTSGSRHSARDGAGCKFNFQL